MNITYKVIYLLAINVAEVSLNHQHNILLYMYRSTLRPSTSRFLHEYCNFGACMSTRLCFHSIKCFLTLPSFYRFMFQVDTSSGSETITLTLFTIHVEKIIGGPSGDVLQMNNWAGFLPIYFLSTSFYNIFTKAY